MPTSTSWRAANSERLIPKIGTGRLWDVHCVAYTHDRRSAFARVTAHVPRSGRKLRIEQTLAYEIDENGLVSSIEVFW